MSVQDILGQGPPGRFSTEGIGSTGGKNGLIDVGDRHKLGPIMFPGSAISHSLVNPNKIQKKVIESKLEGTEDYNPYDNAQRLRYQEYDSRPDVIQRRWENMSFWTKIQTIDWLNHYAFWTFNTGVFIFCARMATPSFKFAGKVAVGWLALIAACGNGTAVTEMMVMQQNS